MGPFGSNIKVECFVDEGIPVLNGSNLEGYELKEDSFRYVTEEKADSLNKANAYRGDIVITHRGTLGQIVFIPQTSKFERYVISQSQFRVRCNDKVLPEYMVYYFHTRIGQHKLLSNASQVGVPALARPSTTFQKIDIEIPDITTQQQIVAILQKIHDKIAINTAINENLEQQAQSIFSNLFPECMSNGIALSSIIDVRDGTHDSPKAKEKGYYLITSKHLQAYSVNKKEANLISDEDFKKINERSKVEYGDILISMIGTVGLISFISDENIDFAIKNVGLFRTSQNLKLRFYLLNYLKTNEVITYIEQHLAGSTQKYISLTELRNLPIHIPSDEELREYNALVSPIYGKIIALCQENQLLASLRDTLLPKLMNGEIDVSEVKI